MPYRPVIGIVFDPQNANSAYQILISRLISEYEFNILQLDCRYFNEEHLKRLVKENLSFIDGLLLPGSPEDIPPEIYGGKRDSKWNYAKNTSLIDYQKAMVSGADKLGMPILGICYGSNVLNVINGGKIEQDITVLDKSKTINHDVFPLKGDLAHDVTVRKNTHLHDILSGNDIGSKKEDLTMKVNSWHHTANKDVPKGFIVSATAPDGVIEAIEREYPGNLNYWGIQFHPEFIDKTKNPEEYKKQSRIYKEFRIACEAHHNKKCFNGTLLQNFKSIQLRKTTTIVKDSPVVVGIEQEQAQEQEQKRNLKLG